MSTASSTSSALGSVVYSVVIGSIGTGCVGLNARDSEVKLKCSIGDLWVGAADNWIEASFAGCA